MDKLSLLLNKLNIENKYFENGKLDKIICNKNKDKYLFCLTLNNILPLKIYIKFIHNLKKHFNQVNVSARISAKNYTEKDLKEYYNHFLA